MSDLSYDVEIEQALIGSCLIDVAALDRSLAIVRPAQFFDPLHQRVMTLLATARAKSEVVSPLALIHSLKSDPAAGEIDIPNYIKSLARSAPAIPAVESYSEVVADLAQRRELVRLAHSLESLATQSRNENPTETILQDVQRELGEIAAGGSTGDEPVPISQSAQAAVNRIGRTQRRKRLIEYQVAGLDDVYGGMGEGDLIVLAGRTGMGKSVVAVNIADRVASQGTGVYFGSLEMSRDQIAERWLSSRAYERDSDIPYSNIHLGKVADNWTDAMARDAIEAERVPFFIDDRRGMTLSQMATRIRRLKAKLKRENRPLGLVVVDHLQRIRPDQNYRGNLYAEATETTRALKDLAGNLEVPVLCLAQLSRETEKREDKRPMLSDLRNSGTIEEEADAVILLHRPEYYAERGRREAAAKGAEELANIETQLAKWENRIILDVAKARHGKAQEMVAVCNIACNWISREKA